MKRRYTFVILFILSSFFAANASASNWVRISPLDGLWQFSVGDNMEWANPSTNVSTWDRISVPGKWENHYDGYNGFAWYRRNFNVSWVPEEGEIQLFLGRIDDVDEVFINGVKVGQTGSFFPDFETAHNIDRRYRVPEGLLKPGNNVIAVRVYDVGGQGGIVSGNRIGIYYNSDVELLSLDLSGAWKFSIVRERGLFENSFDDSHWDEIHVPGTWENQGYPDHDGYAWYRTRFEVPDNLKSQTIYLVLGKIDDYDKVYLNGEVIGRTEHLDDFTRYRRDLAWQLYRVYKIPVALLQRENVLVVEVRDEQLDGGIYEGPIGLMTPQNAKIILDRNRPEFWADPIRYIMRYF